MAKSILSAFKEFVEISFWRYKKFKEGKLTNWHYIEFYTSYFGLQKSYYTNKTILDLGCGPRGSLEWADMSKERIGLDPLADKYLKLGAKHQKMKYVKAYSENIPFKNEYFDVVCSFNSLDHVDDVKRTTSEIKRILKKGGLFLLIVDIHNYPTPTEPQSLKWNFLKTYFPDFEVLVEEHYRDTKKGKIYVNARNRISVKNDNEKTGLLVAKLRKL